MRHFLCFFLACILFLPLAAQHRPYAIQWERSFGGSHDENITKGIPTQDRGYVVCGLSYSTDHDVTDNHGTYDYWVVKMDENGKKQWQKSLGGTAYDHAQSIVEIKEPKNGSSFIVAGFTGVPDGDFGNEDGWVVKLDDTGHIVWQHKYGGNSMDRIYDIAATADGGFILAGFSYSTNDDFSGNHGADDFWLLKIDSLGKVEWQKLFGGSMMELAYSVMQCKDGGYIIGGTTASYDGQVTGNMGDYDFWIVKTDISGNLQWEQNFGSMAFDELRELQQTEDGGYILAGSVKENTGDVTGSHGSSDFWVVKTDSKGKMQWRRAYGGSGLDYAYSVRQTKDGGYIIGGETSSNDWDVSGNHGNADCWVVKTDTAGNIEWQKALGGSSYDYGFCVRETKDNGYFVSAETWSRDGDVSNCYGVKDYWVVKLKEEEVSVKKIEHSNNINIQPNPAAASVTIQCDPSVKGARVILYDMAGKQVLQQEFKSNTCILDIASLSSGTYLLQVQDAAANRLTQQKIVKQ